MLKCVHHVVVVSMLFAWVVVAQPLFPLRLPALPPGLATTTATTRLSPPLHAAAPALVPNTAVASHVAPAAPPVAAVGDNAACNAVFGGQPQLEAHLQTCYEHHQKAAARSAVFGTCDACGLATSLLEVDSSVQLADHLRVACPGCGKADKLFDSIVRIWGAVKPGVKALKKIKKASHAAHSRSIAKFAGGATYKLWQVAVGLQRLANDVTKNKKRRATWWIEHRTKASVGRTADNQAAIKTLSQLFVDMNALSDLAGTVSDTAAPLAVLESLPVTPKGIADAMTSANAAKAYIVKEIQSKCKASSWRFKKAAAVLEKAIDLVKEMATAKPKQKAQESSPQQKQQQDADDNEEQQQEQTKSLPNNQQDAHDNDE